MNTTSYIARFVYFLAILVAPWLSCDDKDRFDFSQHSKIAVVTRQEADVTKNGAALSGRVNTNNGEALIEIGICYATAPNPTIDGKKALKENNIDTGAFTLYLEGLKPHTTYYYRAFATNKSGTAYGESLSFVTQSGYVSKLDTQAPTNIMRTSAEIIGQITDNGGYEITSKGFCYSSTTAIPTIFHEKVSLDIQSSTFKASLSPLKAGTKYYARAYASSEVGTGYGPIISFTTAAPIVASGLTTTSATAVTASAASLGGQILEDNGSPVSARGLCYSTTNLPTVTNGTVLTLGAGVGSFSGQLTGLRANTTYYVRAFATNAAGTAYGSVLSFKTLLPALPSNLNTYNPSSISQNSAYLSGNVGSAGGGIISARGIVYSNSTSSPTISSSLTLTSGSGLGAFGATAFGLSSGTTYYARAFATNEAGTVYGNLISFTTASPYTAPTGVSTYEVSSTAGGSATFSGYVATNGGSTITERGFVYSMAYANPTLNTGSKAVVLGTTVGNFSRSVTGLSRYTTYYVRAFATNGYGTTYGTSTSFYHY